VEKGFRQSLSKGRLIGFPVLGLRVVIDDGQSHSVDSSEMAFQAAARGAFRTFYDKARPRILEPIMKLEVEGPGEFQGAILKTIMQRRGHIIGSTEEEGFSQEFFRPDKQRKIRVIFQQYLQLVNVRLLLLLCLFLKHYFF